jgi:asparagine synthase (glutamine-hydrolysing)
MCGICVTAKWRELDDLQPMNALQRHRGPNDCGVWHRVSPDDSRFALGSTRLSIIDLSPAGHMPMSNEDGTVWIAYNGKIYNVAELRSKLETRVTFFVRAPTVRSSFTLYPLARNARQHLCGA